MGGIKGVGAVATVARRAAAGGPAQQRRRIRSSISNEWVHAGLSPEEFNFLDPNKQGNVDPRNHLLVNDTLAARSNDENFGDGFCGRAVAVPVDRWARIGRWKRMMEDEGGFQCAVLDPPGSK